MSVADSPSAGSRGTHPATARERLSYHLHFQKLFLDKAKLFTEAFHLPNIEVVNYSIPSRYYKVKLSLKITR